MKYLLKNAEILAGETFTPLKNAYLGIDGDTICYIGTEKPEGFDAVKDMTGRLLLPGLVNTHTHTPMTLLRGVGSGLPLQEWLFDKVFPIEDRMTAEDIRVGTQLALLEMLGTGTTSFSDMYMLPEVTIEEVLKAGLKANITRPVQCFDLSERPGDNTRVKESVALFDAFNGAGDGRILIDFCVHAEYTCTAPVVEYYSAFCKERGGNMHVHLSETKKEHDECVAKYGRTPARWFADLGAFDSRAFAAHCVWLTDEDIELFRERGVAAVHNPSSNMKLGSGFAPVRKLLDRGVTVGLGTDGAASNNNLNMFEEMHLASVLHNGLAHDPTVLQPAEILRMAASSGAKIQGRSDTGVLAVGKKADIIAIDLDRPHLTPNLDSLALTCYAAQGSDVCMTMVNGRILYENGEFLTVDRDRVLFEAKRASERLLAG